MAQLSSEEAEAVRLLGYFFLRHGLYEKAATLLGTLERLDTQRPAAQARALAVARDRLGQPARALEALDRLAMSGQMDEQFHALRAKLLGDLDRWDEARLAMDAALACRQTHTQGTPAQ